MRVEVAYATPAQQVVIAVELAPGASAQDAIRASGILAHFPELNLTTMAIGIFGERAALTDAVQEGDRVEIYRPLQADPKEARRRRARRRR